MSKKQKISVPAREKELRRIIASSRDSLTANLEELKTEIQPKTQLGYAKEDLKFRAETAQVAALNTIDEAREGNREAIKKIAILAASVVGTVALLVINSKIKKARRSR